MTPIVAIVGKSKSGKTTFMEKLILELKSRGYRVATIKHSAGKLTFDRRGKDSWRHIQAGSEATAVVSSNEFVLIKPVDKYPDLMETARTLGANYDIILAEGFKQSNVPKIEVHRKAAGTPLSKIRKLIAIATDEPLETNARQFSTDDIKGIADLLEKGFIIPQRERISLYVNNIPVLLTTFPKEIISNILIAMASSLKGIRDIEYLEIFLRKETKT